MSVRSQGEQFRCDGFRSTGDVVSGDVLLNDRVSSEWIRCRMWD